MKRCRALVLSGLLAAPAAAGDVERVEILALGGYTPEFSLRALDPLERAISKSSAVVLVGIDAVPVSYRGRAYHYDPKDRPPGTAPVEATQVGAFDTPDGTLFFTPAEPGLLEAVLDDVKTERQLPWFARAKVRLTPEKLGAGLSAEVVTSRTTAAQDRDTMALLYHLTVSGRPVDAVFILRTRGGLGRLASLLQRRPADGAARIIVSLGSPDSRGGQFTLHGRMLFEALERLGLRVSAMGRGELRDSDALDDYRSERPDRGIRFLSANVPFQDFPGTTVVEAGGLKVGFLGLTDSAAARYSSPGIRPVSIEETLAAARRAVQDLKPEADLVVALSNLNAADNDLLREKVQGLDLIIGAAGSAFTDDAAHAKTVSLESRGVLTPALAFTCERGGADRFEAALGPKNDYGARPLSVRHEPLILDDSLADAEGYPRFNGEIYAVGPDTAAVIMPSAHRISASGRIRSVDFWTMVAALFTDRTRSEAGLFPISEIAAPVPGDFSEGEIRTWFDRDDALVVFEINGSDLKSIVKRGKEGSSGGQAGLAVSGLDHLDRIHGADIDSSQVYRVVSTARALAESSVNIAELGRFTNLGDLQDETVAELKRRAQEGWRPEQYAAAMQGRPIRDKGYWTINLRDISIAFSQARIVKDSKAFDGVPGDKIQNFDDQTVKVGLHVAADYRHRSHKWSGRLDIDYSEQTVDVPAEPVLIFNPDNQIAFQLAETLHLYSFPLTAIGQSIGPTLGFRYEGQVKRESPDVRRVNIYSILPGIEIYDGTWIKSLQLTGNLKRDYSLEPPRSDFGMRLNIEMEHSLSMSRGREANLQGRIWSNYFFRKHGDSSKSLLIDGSAAFKLQIPIWKNVTVAPFWDIYFFKLKSRPASGYATTMGVSLGFSRLWKPQYEKF